MADDDFDDLDLPDEPTGNADWAAARRRARDEATARQAAEQRAQAAERELAFARAGIPLDSPMAGYFVRGYNGDLSTEAIQAAAREAGVLASAGEQPPAAPVPDPGQTPQVGAFPSSADVAAQQAAVEIAAQQRVAGAGAGAAPASADAEGVLIEAFRTGGQEAMLATAQSLGIPIADDGVVRL